MADVKNEEGAVEDEDLDGYDDDGIFDQLGAKIKNTYSFRFKAQTLSCDALEDDPIFKKLKKRLIQFHIINEKVRVNGLTNKQKEDEMRTGIKFRYLVQLHKCLKKMLREVIITDDK